MLKRECPEHLNEAAKDILGDYLAAGGEVGKRNAEVRTEPTVRMGSQTTGTHTLATKPQWNPASSPTVTNSCDIGPFRRDSKEATFTGNPEGSRIGPVSRDHPNLSPLSIIALLSLPYPSL